jgi:S1-C subfamily serine protease
MRRLWLIFAQAVTVAVAVLFAVQTLRPGWLGGAEAVSNGVQILQESPSNGEARPVASFSNAAQRALPSVVHIYTTQEVRSPKNPLLNDPFFRHFFGDRFGEEKQQRSGLGSGVIVSPDGYILTNNHVVEGADQIEVALNDARKLKAEVVGTDPESDLAVLKVAADAGLVPITFAQPRSLKVGDVVLAIGNPFGVGQTVTSGIVSALDRTHLGINTFEDFIQTDAAINPGNSGGALVDSNGVLVGINTAIYSQSGGSMGIGFAIPISLVQNVLEQIIKNGGVTRGWIGVEVQEITPELADSFRGRARRACRQGRHQAGRYPAGGRRQAGQGCASDAGSDRLAGTGAQCALQAAARGQGSGPAGDHRQAAQTIQTVAAGPAPEQVCPGGNPHSPFTTACGVAVPD